MESIYNPKPFRASEHLDLDSYFKEFSEICSFPEQKIKCHNNQCDRESFLSRVRQEMNVPISMVELNQLEDTCGINALTLDDEPEGIPVDIPGNLHTKTKIEKVYPVNDKARQLNVIQCSNALEKKYDFESDFKFGGKRFIKTATMNLNKPVLCDMNPGSNVIYSIIVYRPFSIKFSEKNCGDKLRYAFEIEALATNTLAEIADKIECITNEGLFVEVDNPDVDLSPLMNAKEHYPSQCIFIDGVLYNDMRHPKAIDYSYNIIKWAKDHNIGKFTSECMEKTRLSSLKPRLGYPYVYMHQGNCEHVFSFSDVRLLQPGDCLNSRKYPCVSSVNRECNILCFICSVLHAQWIVLECDKFPHEKVFLCTNCCKSYLYVDGKKVTEFRLYPYYDREMLERYSSVIIE